MESQLHNEWSQVSIKNFTSIEKPSIILLLLKIRKLHAEQISSYLGKLHKKYQGGIIIKFDMVNLREIVEQITV